MWPFARKPIQLHITIESVSLLHAQPGDVVLVALPTDWNPRCIREFHDIVEKAFKPKLPAGVQLIFVPGAAPFQVMRLSASQPQAKQEKPDGD